MLLVLIMHIVFIANSVCVTAVFVNCVDIMCFVMANANTSADVYGNSDNDKAVGETANSSDCRVCACGKESVPRVV